MLGFLKLFLTGFFIFIVFLLMFVTYYFNYKNFYSFTKIYGFIKYKCFKNSFCKISSDLKKFFSYELIFSDYKTLNTKKIFKYSPGVLNIIDLNTIKKILVYNPISKKELLLNFSKNTYLGLSTIYCKSPKYKQLLLKFLYIKQNTGQEKNKIFNFYKNLLKSVELLKSSSIYTSDIITGIKLLETILNPSNLNSSNITVSSVTGVFIHKPFLLTIFNKQFFNMGFINVLTKNKSENIHYIKSISGKLDYQVLESTSSIINGGIPITVVNSPYNPQFILDKLFFDSLVYKNNLMSTITTSFFGYTLILEALIKQYYISGIKLPGVYFEIIATKMTSLVQIKFTGDTSYEEQDYVVFTYISMINIAFITFGYKNCLFKPTLVGLIKSKIGNSGFLTKISFQNTLKHLGEAFFSKTVEWMVDLKTKLFISDLGPHGTGWYRHFNK